MRIDKIIYIALLLLAVLVNAEVKINGLDKLFFRREIDFDPSKKVKELELKPQYLNEAKLFNWDDGESDYSYWVKDFLLFSNSDSENIWLREVLTNSDMKNEKVWWTIYKGDKICDSWSFDPYYSSSSTPYRKALSNYRMMKITKGENNSIAFRIKCWMYRNGYGWSGYKDFVFNRNEMSLEYMYVINTLTVHYDDNISMSTEELDNNVFLSKKIENILDETFSQCGVSIKSEMSLDDYFDIVDCIFNKQNSETSTRKISEQCFVERSENDNNENTGFGGLIDGLTK